MPRVKRPIVTVKIDQRVVGLLHDGIAEGVLRTAEAGKERSLEYAREKFRSTRMIEKHAYAVAFDGTERKGDRRGPMAPDTRQKAVKNDGPLGYFGNDWFVMRFHEQGTVKMPARPTISTAANDLNEIMPAKLLAAVKEKGF